MDRAGIAITCLCFGCIGGFWVADKQHEAERTYCRVMLEDGRRLLANDLGPNGENNCRYIIQRPPIKLKRQG